MLDHPKSQWFILGSNDRNRNAILDLIDDLNMAYVELKGWCAEGQDSFIEDGFLIWNPQYLDDDELRFLVIKILNNKRIAEEWSLVKYKLEPVAYKVKRTGYEEPYGRAKMGIGQESTSWIFNRTPFHVERDLDYHMSYEKFKVLTI